MRTDATIDRVQVYCPNVQSIGFNKAYARKNYIVVWNDNGIRRLARVAGRVHYAPECGSKEQGTYTPAIRDYLFLVVLNTSASSLWLRWVPPHEIEECYTPEDYSARIQNTVNNFLSDKWGKMDFQGIAGELGC